MTNSIKVIFNNNREKDTINIPLLEENDIETVSPQACSYNQNSYSFVQEIPTNVFIKKDNDNKEFADFSNCEPLKEGYLSLLSDKADNTIPHTLLIKQGNDYQLYVLIDNQEVEKSKDKVKEYISEIEENLKNINNPDIVNKSEHMLKIKNAAYNAAQDLKNIEKLEQLAY